MHIRYARLLAAVAVATSALAVPSAGTAATPARKVMVIVEENRTYAEIVGSTDAPVLTKLAATYGSARAMTANYPVACPSLAGYVLITSGTTAGICDDKAPKHHALTQANIFAQVDAAHLTWKTYAEATPAGCSHVNSTNAVFLVRHTPVAYYPSEASRCAADDVSLGSTTSGALRTDVSRGTLPSYSFVVPDACDDMHGAPSCPGHRVADGDAWAATWLPRIMAGPDYRAGRLTVIITWDEGSSTSNTIPTIVISPTTHAVSSSVPLNHCSTLRTTEDLLRLAPIGCAATATSMVGVFHLP